MWPSEFVASRGLAIAAALSVVVVMQFFWNHVFTGLYYLLDRSMGGQQLPTWYVLPGRLSPSGADTYPVEHRRSRWRRRARHHV
jgi:hypothetical protein